MTGGGQQRGWIIVGIDLLIVLGVYLLYSQFAVSPTANTLTLNDQLRYELTVSPVRGDTLPVSLSVSNTASEARSTQLPDGIVLFLATGDGENKFWAVEPHEPGQLTLDSGETRTWQYAPRYPGGIEEPLYVALFVDESRQGKVEVPH